MVRFRPVLTLILVLFTVVLVGCGGPTKTVKAPTYTADQLDRIEQYTSNLFKDRRRMEKELTAEIEGEDWSDVRSLIHGPLGEVRQDMNNLARNLPKEAQADAREVAKGFFKDLVGIDEAAQKQDATAALRAYRAALEQLDEILELTVTSLEGAKS